MAKIQRFRASVDYCTTGAYHLTALHEHYTFTISEKAMHSKVHFPADMLDKEGRLKRGVEISVIAKTNDEGNVNHYPDTNVYGESTRPQRITEEEYAANLLNFLDHSDEIDPTIIRDIVKAIATSSAESACKLISKALFKL